MKKKDKINSCSICISHTTEEYEKEKLYLACYIPNGLSPDGLSQLWWLSPDGLSPFALSPGGLRVDGQNNNALSHDG